MKFGGRYQQEHKNPLAAEITDDTEAYEYKRSLF